MNSSTNTRKSDFAVDDSQQITFASELARKGTHLGSMIVPGLYYALDMTRAQALWIMVPVALAMTFADVARLRQWKIWKSVESNAGKLVRAHESAGEFTGAFYQLWMFVLVIALFEKEIAIISSSFIIIGDTFAALIGRRFGKHRFRGKSLEGSLAFLVSVMLVVVIAEQLFTFPYTVAITGAVVATVVEAIPDSIDDNLSVPLVSGLVMTMMLKLFYAA